MKSWIVPVALVWVSVACGGDKAGSPSVPREFPKPKPAAAAATPTPPADAAAAAATPASFRGDAEHGQALYVQFCATCHGAGGKGDGPAATQNPRPADHTDAAYMGSLTDEQIYTVIEKGGGAVGKSPLMIAWGAVLPDRDIRDVVAYIRQLSGT